MRGINRKYIDVHLTRALSIFAVLFLYDAYLCFDNFHRGNTLIGAVALFCSVMTLVSVVSMSVCRFGRVKSKLPVHITVSAMCVVYWITFGILIFTGGTDGTSIFLLFAVSPISFFFFNLFYGTIFTTVLFSGLVIYVASPLLSQGFMYPESYYQRLPVMLFIEIAVCWLAQYQMVKAEIRQDEAIGEARRANEVLREFFANASHEIRTPMNSIAGFTELLLREESLSPKAEELCRNILGAGKNLLCKINDLLDISLLDAGKLTISEIEFETGKLVMDIRNSSMACKGDKDIEIVINAQKDLPPRLCGDQARIFQIVMNLIDNAVRYTSKGGVYIEVMVDRFASPMLVVRVRDTGAGIKEEELDKLFTGSASGGNDAPGPGLGLRVSRRIASFMGGVITAESEYGKGSVFVLRVPVKIADSGAINGEDKAGFTAPTAKILIVDDNDVNLMVESRLMQVYGMKVSVAGSGQEALDMADRECYDIIFMDQMMPGMDGVETVKRMRKNSAYNKNTVVIALTANAVSGARELFLENGFQDYLPKPLDVAELDAVIRKYIPSYRVCLKNDEADGRQGEDEAEAVFSEGSIRIMEESGLIDPGEIKKYMTDPEILIMYSDTYTVKNKEIEKYYRSKDWKNYNIQVHALKSSSRMVGAVSLSDLARRAETASAKGDESVLDEIHPLLMKQYEDVVGIIDKITGKN